MHSGRCQHFCRDSSLIISKTLLGYPQFFVDSDSPCKDLLFPRGSKLAQKPGRNRRGYGTEGISGRDGELEKP